MWSGSLTRFFALLTVGAAVLLLSGSALGTSFTVTTTADSGPGSLRQAILDANATPGADQISIPPGTYLPTSPLPDVTDDLTIVGAGSSTTIIDGSNNVTAGLTVDPGLTFVASGITFANAGGEGIADLSGGSATLTNVALTHNGGVGVSSEGNLTIVQSTIENNGDDGVFLDFLSSPGTLRLDDSTIADNDGNGVEEAAGSATLSGDTISGSSLNGVLANAHLSISSSTIAASGIRGIRAAIGATLTSDTVTGSQGAGVDLLGDSTVTGTTVAGGGDVGILSEGGTLALTSSTVSGNSGGGVKGQGGIVTLVNDTIAGNSGGVGGLGVETQIDVENTIVAGNVPVDCDANAEDLGHDLESGTSCGFLSLDDFQDTDPLLGPLQDNGGPTFTRALDPASVAVDAGSDAACPAIDQRGTSRPQGAHCDLGAFELVQAGGGAPVVSPTTSTIVAAPASLPADGATTATITVTLRDGSGSPVAGRTVTLSAGSGSSTISTLSGTTDGSGATVFSVKDATAENVTYSATDTTDVTALASTATVTFTALRVTPSPPAPAPPAPPTVTVSPPAASVPVQAPNHPPVIRYLIRAAPGTAEPMIDASLSYDPDGDFFSTEIHVVYCAGCPPPFSAQFAPPFDSYSYTPIWINTAPYNGILTATITETDTRGSSSTTTFTIEDPLTAFPLTVQVAGRLVSAAQGAGEVVGDLPHLDCRSSCTAMVPLGATVRLRAQQIPGGEQFVGWSGACSGTGDCVLGLGGPGTLVAQFGDAAPPQNVSPPQISDTPGAPPGPMPFSYYVSGGPFHPSYGTPAYAYVGTWDLPKPSSYEIRWLRCGTTPVCTAIPGATARRYVPTLADVGKKLEVSVTAIRGGVASVAAYSAGGLQALVDHHLHTATEPKTVTTGAVVVGQAGTEATIGGTFIAGAQDWTYGFVWGEGALDHSVSLGSWSQASGFTFGNIDDSSQPVTTQLTGLVPGHTYEYELVATTSSTKYASFPATTIDGGVRTFVASPDSSRPAFLSVDFVPAGGQEPTRLHVTVVPGATPVVFSGTWSGGSDTGQIQSGRINAGATPASQDAFYLDLNGLDPIQQGLTYTYSIVADNGTGNTVTFTGSATVPWNGALTTLFPGSITATGASFYAVANVPTLDSPSFVIGGGPTIQTAWEKPCAVCTGSMSASTNALSPGTSYTVQAQGFSEVPTQHESCPNGLPVRANPFDNSQFCDGPLVQGQVLRFTTPNEQPTGATFSGSTLGLSLGCVTSTGCGGSMAITTPTQADFVRGFVSQVERGLAGVAAMRSKAPVWARSVPLGTRSFRIAGGKRLRIAFAPSQAGRRYLVAHPSLRAVVVTLTERRSGRKPVVIRSLTPLRRSR